MDDDVAVAVAVNADVDVDVAIDVDADVDVGGVRGSRWGPWTAFDCHHKAEAEADAEAEGEIEGGAEAGGIPVLIPRDPTATVRREEAG